MVYFTAEQIAEMITIITKSLNEYKDNGSPSDDPDDIDIYERTKSEFIGETLSTMAKHIHDIIEQFEFTVSQ